ncbi:MAG: hypothetical protein K2K55_05740 [Duncaniella sp.]|nr:hypothetical protein [Duncaniella sp.]
MKLAKIFYVVLAALAVTACSKDSDPDYDEGSKVTIPDGERIFVLNQGIWGMNNTCITLFSPKTSTTIDNLFYKQNGVMMGDNAQDMIVHDHSIYVSMNGSNYIMRLNEAGVEQARISFVDDADLHGGVRYIEAEGHSIYATFYGGWLVRLNDKTLAIEAKLKTSGANLEGILIEDGKIYVADSYGIVTDPTTQATNYVYNENLIVVDLKTFREEKTIKVAPNPNLLAEEDGKIFLISWGNYADKGNDFQIVDPRTGKVTSIAEAKDMAVGNGKVYLLKTYTDWTSYTTTNTWMSYDIRTGKLNTESFLKNAPDVLASTNISLMDVDDETGDIYIGVTYYSAANGDIYRFDRNGNFIEQFDAGGQNPFKAISVD